MTSKLSILPIFFALSSCALVTPYPRGTDWRTAVVSPEEERISVKPQGVVRNAVKKPLDDVCRVLVHRQKGYFGQSSKVNSGVLIDGRYIITAGHSLYEWPLYSSFPKTIDVFQGVADTTNQLPTFTLSRKHHWLAPRYQWRPRYFSKGHEELQFDYAFIDTGKVHSSSQLFKVGGAPEVKIGTKIFIAGYPYESADSTYNGTKLCYTAGRVVAVSDSGRHFVYDIHTHGGNSGGPVWFYNESTGSYHLIGVHISANKVTNRGTARAVNDEFLQDWNNWLKSRPQ